MRLEHDVEAAEVQLPRRLVAATAASARGGGGLVAHGLVVPVEPQGALRLPAADAGVGQDVAGVGAERDGLRAHLLDRVEGRGEVALSLVAVVACEWMMCVGVALPQSMFTLSP